jgi:hypothetical protein
MASAFLIERTKNGAPRSIIMSSTYPCDNVDPKDQNLLASQPGATYATAKQIILNDLRLRNPEKAERLATAIANNERLARQSGRSQPTMTEVTVARLPPDREPAPKPEESDD